MEEDDIQSRLSSLQNLKHFVWIMSEYLGRERAAVAALVASGKPMSSQEISNLAAFRGRLEVAWDYVQAYAAKSSAPANVVAGTERVRENVFRRFEETRKSVYAAGLGGGTYPINSAEWFAQSTKAVDDVIALSALASQEAAKLAEVAQRSSLHTLLLTAMLMAFSILLAAGALWIVLIRCQDQRSAAPPAPHQFGSHQFLLFRCFAMGSQKIAKRAHMLFHSQIGNVAAVARESFGLWQPSGRTFFVRVAKKKFAGFDRWARAGCRLLFRSCDDRLREPVAVAEVFVSVVERGNRFQIQSR